MIDKEKPIKVVYCEDCYHLEKDDCINEWYSYCYRNQRYVPNDFYCADGEKLVHGHWIIYPDVCVCSECNEQSSHIVTYCPKCEALMDEEAKEGWD